MAKAKINKKTVQKGTLQTSQEIDIDLELARNALTSENFGLDEDFMEIIKKAREVGPAFAQYIWGMFAIYVDASISADFLFALVISRGAQQVENACKRAMQESGSTLISNKILKEIDEALLLLDTDGVLEDSVKAYSLLESEQDNKVKQKTYPGMIE